MKKSFILGAIVCSFVLSACSLFKTYNASPKEVEVYLVDSATKGNKKIEECKLGTIAPLFLNGEGYVPYFSLEQYASLYQPYFEEGVKSEVENDGYSSAWTIYKGEDLYFYAVITPLTKTIMTAGSISHVLKSDSNPNDYSLISKYTRFEDQTVRLSDKTYATYNYAGYAFKSFSKNNKRYYPLGLLDNAFSECSSIYHFYNYKNIYATWDVENYAMDFERGGAFGGTSSVDKEMEEVTQGQTIPNYLLEYNASCFLFVMDNFYGLKSYYNIKSMKEYFSEYTFYRDFFSTDGETRGYAYSAALSLFDDHHTGLISANNAWGEGETKAMGGMNVIKRQYQDEELTNMRKASFGEGIDYKYSSDHKTVLFYFDGFELGTPEEVFNTDGSLKEDAYKHDSYYNVLQRLQHFKADGRVENVILDLSTNGGGVIGLMAKILALISKKNAAKVTLFDGAMDMADVSTCSVDVNMDGQFTEDETFGNDFNFYVMCSNCSFSCGNAFPCYAQNMGIKIIGETSGGGECAVGIHYLPNSEYVYHSSTTHIGYYDEEKNTFIGFESGATPDISLVPAGKTSLSEYIFDDIYYNIPNNMYDVDYLASLLS